MQQQRQQRLRQFVRNGFRRQLQLLWMQCRRVNLKPDQLKFKRGTKCLCYRKLSGLQLQQQLLYFQQLQFLCCFGVCFGSTINVYGLATGSTNISVCASGSVCATLYVTVGGSGYNNSGTITFSPSSVNLAAGQSSTVFVNAAYLGSSLYIPAIATPPWFPPASAAVLCICRRQHRK